MTPPLRASIASCLLLSLLGPGAALGAGEVLRTSPSNATRLEAVPAAEVAPSRRALRKAEKQRRKNARKNASLSTAKSTGAAQTARPAVATLAASPKPAGPGQITASPSQGGASGPNLRVEAIVQPSSPEGFPNSGFCGPKGFGGGASTQVRFFVRNVGDVPADPSTAAVHFTDGGMTTAQVGSLMPGASATIEIDIPQACWGNGAHGTCDFLLEADRNDSVDETEDSADNYENGKCMLPGT